jgi:hypothetical protein
MAEPTLPVDVRIYGANQPTPLGIGGNPATEPVSAYAPPAAVPASSIMTGSPLLAEGAANLRANQREKATVLESMGGAIDQWLPQHIYEFLTTPAFAWEKDFKPAEAVRSVDFGLNLIDEEFLLKSRSNADFQHRLDTIRTRNEAHVAMGDHSTAAFIAGAVDPTYIAIDIASFGTARALRAGRAVAGATAVGLTATAGLIEQQVTPTSNLQIALMAGAMGTASTLFYRGGKLVPKDPAWPGAALGEVMESMKNGGHQLDEVAEAALKEPTLIPHMQIGGRGAAGVPFEAGSARQVLKSIAAGSDAVLAPLARRVEAMLLDDVQVRTVTKAHLAQGSRPFYDPRQHAVFIAKDTSPAMQLHEITHAVTANKVEFGLKHIDSAHGKIVRELEDVRLAAIKQFEATGGSMKGAASGKNPTPYYLSDPHEFIAGLFSGKSQFTDMLAAMPVKTGERNVLERVVDSVRRVLGMAPREASALEHTLGLTEKLGKLRLNATLNVAGAGSHSIRMAPTLASMGASAADAVKTVMSSKDVARAVEWSWHKTFGKFSAKSKEIADLLMDSPTAMAGNSAASIQRALRADMSSFQYKYEDLLLDAMGSRGFGLMQRIMKTTEAIKVQQGIEKDVAKEMLRRNRSAKDGVPHSSTGVDPAITAMADSLDALSKRALAEMKAAGVAGAELVSESAGYFTRRWDIGKLEGIARRLQEHGPQPAGAVRQKIVDTIGIAIQRSNGWDAQVANDVAGAIYDRTMRKGLFQDNEFFAGMGADTTGQLRNMLTAEGMSGARLQRVLDVLEGKADAAGKMPVMKQRVDMHMDEALALPDGTRVTIMDMLDTNIASITERYLDATTARAAMARKGLASPTEITLMRTQLAESIADVSKRAEAVESFDQMLNVLQGLPVGEKMLKSMRDIQAVTQMVGLASSGLWQLTEYSTIMAQHGAGRVMRSAIQELPFIRNMVKHEATSLREVLARNSAQDTRLRPFINRMEDNFEIPMSEAMSLSLMQAKQMVPYANAMKFIQRHQARTTANLIVDTIQRGAKGDAKALAALEAYGLESGSMTKVGADIRAHGMDTAKWSDATWHEVRGPLTKMMDEAVLRARLGEMPQFAHTSTVGKFLFTFRSFVLAAHNKVLANTLSNGGYAGMGLLLMYQLPLTVLATWVNTGIQGKDQADLEGTIKKALGQAGAFGLFSELFGVLAGTKEQFGTPGLIGVDRMYKVAGALASGSAGDTAAAALNATPIYSAILPLRAISEALKDGPAPQE